MTVVLPTFIMEESSELFTRSMLRSVFAVRENLIPSTGTAASKTRSMVSGTSFVYKHELPKEKT